MSKKKLLLVGAGGFGRMVAEQAMIQYDCAFVDDGQDVDTEICGIPVVGSLANLPQYVKEPYKRFLENKIREKWNLSGTPINIFIRQK